MWKALPVPIPPVLPALHKVFTEREEGTANNMFLHS